MDAKAPSAPTLGRHFLRSRSLAADIVREAGIDAGHVVVEIGAGTGLLTEALALRARRVIAVELDERLASRLARRMAGSNVEVVCHDALSVALPEEPFRVVGNIPFGITTALLHRLLDDPSRPLLRADLVVQLGAAIKRSSGGPNVVNLCWAPWWELAVGRKLRRDDFTPRPSVEAAVLVAVRRREPLLPAADRDEWVRFLRDSYARGERPRPSGRARRAAAPSSPTT